MTLTRGLPPTQCSFSVISLTIKNTFKKDQRVHRVQITLESILSHNDQQHQSYNMNQK